MYNLMSFLENLMREGKVGVLRSLLDSNFADKMNCVSLDENCFLLKSVSIFSNVQVFSYLYLLLLSYFI